MWIWKVNGFSEAQVKYLITIQTKLYYISSFQNFIFFKIEIQSDHQNKQKQYQALVAETKLFFLFIYHCNLSLFNQTVTWKDLSYRVI